MAPDSYATIATSSGQIIVMLEVNIGHLWNLEKRLVQLLTTITGSNAAGGNGNFLLQFWPSNAGAPTRW